MPAPIDRDRLDQALTLLSSRLELIGSPPVRLVVCGGSALIQLGLRLRTTKDLDVVALLDSDHGLISPDPLPESLATAADQVARDLGLFEGWLNNGPSRGEGGLFQLGLPTGLVSRLTEKCYGPQLKVCFVSRIDQIHFKLYAAADQRSGRHMNDLLALSPSGGELEAAARWTMTHDPSDGFRMVLQELLTQLGHGNIAQGL